MTPAEWKRIGNLVEQALALDGEQRTRFLDELGKEEPALLKEVESYISIYEADKNFLETPAVEGLSFIGDAEESQYIDEYKIIRPLGEGGMGEVFLAQRQDEALTDPVAIKLIRAGLSQSDYELERFKMEQQILAGLKHQNIARILDAGAADDGRPYFVMDYVDGISLTAYCDKHKLDIDERLTLFLQVCDAVDFAHQQLIVHRDLKPGNLLVNRAGEVKLLDFGIAKALSPWQSGLSSLQTKTGFRVLTPRYASPEQILGGAISTASDVYSLGVLLYELLSGHLPYELSQKTEAEAIRIITEQEPRRPSDVISQGYEHVKSDGTTEVKTPDDISEFRRVPKDQLQRKLKGELDNIVLMALRKEVDRRYATAAGLREDIKRYLKGHTVSAQPDTFRYRAGKFVSRHVKGMVAVAIILLLLIGFSAVTFVQASRIRAKSEDVALARDKAELAAEEARDEAKKAEEVVQVLIDLFSTSNPEKYPGADTLSIKEFLLASEDNVLEQLEGEPETQARLKHIISKLYWARGDVEEAVNLLDSTIVQQQEIKGEMDTRAALMLRDRALLYLEESRPDTAVVMLREVERILRAGGEKDAPELAVTLLKLMPLLPLSSADEKERMLVEADSIIESAEEPDAIQRASVANQLGVFYHSQSRYEDSVDPFERSVANLEEAVGKTHPYYLVASGNLASVYMQVGQLEKARDLHEQVLEVRQSQQDSYYDRGVIFTQSQLGMLYIRLGDAQKAVEYLKEAYEVSVKKLGSDDLSVRGYAINYGNGLIQAGESLEVVDSLQLQAMRITRAGYGEDSSEYAWALYQRGNYLRLAGQDEESLETLNRALALWEEKVPDDDYAPAYHAIMIRGLLHLDQGRYELAYDDINAHLQYLLVHQPLDKDMIAISQLWTGAALTKLGRHDEATPLINESVYLLENPGVLSPDNYKFITELLALRKKILENQ